MDHTWHHNTAQRKEGTGFRPECVEQRDNPPLVPHPPIAEAWQGRQLEWPRQRIRTAHTLPPVCRGASLPSCWPAGPPGLRLDWIHHRHHTHQHLLHGHQDTRAAPPLQSHTSAAPIALASASRAQFSGFQLHIQADTRTRHAMLVPFLSTPCSGVWPFLLALQNAPPGLACTPLLPQVPPPPPPPCAARCLR